MEDAVLSRLHRDLQAQADVALQQGMRRYFKEEVVGYGVSTAAVRTIAQHYYRQIKDREKEEIWRLCDALLATGYMEDAFIASDWSYRLQQKYTPDDFPLFERWIGQYIDNWAKCDTFCNHTMGAFLERYPSFLPRLREWTGSGNRWCRRAAAVSLILPARKGLFLPDILDIASRLLRDNDDLVQKGYGWMLKEASKRHPEVIFIFVMQHRQEMPRTALRYAIEKLPMDQKKQAMER
jgi:Predicted DNA alkylation repair enzyme